MRVQIGGSLFDRNGLRKYLTPLEAVRFLDVADTLRSDLAALCGVLHWTGCRISEALELGPNRVDLECARVVLRTLKRHHRGQVSADAAQHFRIVPVPSELIEQLARLTPSDEGLYWPCSRQSAWRLIKWTMEAADISGIHACPKGLRHHFGLMAISAGVPLSLLQRWMGHAKVETTLLYLEMMAAEERGFAERMWRSQPAEARA